MTEIIRTAEELAALPEWTVIRFPTLVPVGQVRIRDGRKIVRYGTEWGTPDVVIRRYAPLTVLYRPDLPTQADLHATVERVRGMHRPDPNDNAFCQSCDRQFPCPTWRELGGAP